MSQATKIQILVTMVSTPHNAAITDSTIKEDSEDEDMPTTKDEVSSIAIEHFYMVIRKVVTTTAIRSEINLKSTNQQTKNTSRKPHILNRFVISVVIRTTTQEIVTNGDQRTKTNKCHVKQRQNTSEATPLRKTTRNNG